MQKKDTVINAVPRFILEFIFLVILSIFLYLNFNKEDSDQFANLAVLGVLLLKLCRASIEYQLIIICSKLAMSSQLMVEKIKNIYKKLIKRKLTI